MPEPEVTLGPHSTVVNAFSRAFARQNSQFEKGKFHSIFFVLRNSNDYNCYQKVEKMYIHVTPFIMYVNQQDAQNSCD